MEMLTPAIGVARNILDFPLFQLGDTPLTVWTPGYITVLIAALIFVSGRIRPSVARGTPPLPAERPQLRDCGCVQRKRH